MTSSLDRDDKAASAAPGEALDVLLWFAALMLRAGNTAIRTREWMEVMARKLGFEAVSATLTLDSVTARRAFSSADSRTRMLGLTVGAPRAASSRRSQ